MNSGFLIVIMGGLSPIPSDETNNLLRLLVLGPNATLTRNINQPFAPAPGVVRQNCFLMASLFSSLIAAAGAILAKQWLANYERTGQTGPLEEQGLRRTEKFLGAEKWGLRYVAEALPTLILISLALFFVAMGDYFWTLNVKVAILIVAFSAAATLLYITMLISAAIFPNSPFQTAPSSTLIHIWHVAIRPTLLLLLDMAIVSVVIPCRQLAHWLWLHTDLPVVDALNDAIHDVAKNYWTPMARIRDLRPRQDSRKYGRENDELCAESARSILTISPHDEAVIAVAQNIVGLSHLPSLERLGRGGAALTMASKVATLLKRFQESQSASDLEVPLVLFKAIVHILSALPKENRIRVLFSLPEIAQPRVKIAPWLSSPELNLLYLTLCRLSIPQPGEIPDVEPAIWRKSWTNGFLFGELIQHALANRSPVSSFTACAYLHSLIIAGDFNTRLSYQDNISVSDLFDTVEWLLSDDTIPSTVSFVCLASRALSDALDYALHSTERGTPVLGEDARIRTGWELRSG